MTRKMEAGRAPETARGRKAGPETPQDAGAALLLQQLHQVQEELELHYLRCVDLDAELQLANLARDEAIREVEALRMQLGHMQASVASREGRREAPPSFGRRLARLVSSRFARRRAGETRARPEIDAIRDCEWFDAAWYLGAYADVRAAGMDPAEHYHEFGWKEGRNPGPAFDTGWYLRTYPDVAAAGLDPLWHFVEYGCKEGRLPLDA